MPVCTGCVVFVNGAGTTPLDSSWTTGASQQVLGSGIGQFAGVTGFLLGNFTVAYRNADPGTCTGYAGSLAITGQSGTGLFTYDPTKYFCSGESPCIVEVKTQFVANPLLSGIAPGFAIIGTHFDSEGNSYAQKLTASSPTYTFPGGTYTGNCGFSDYMTDVFRGILAPYSGWIAAEISTVITCGPCLSGA